MFKPRRFAGGNFPEDYLSWTANVETCIWNNRLPKSERLFLAVSSLRGEARRWWETYESRRWAKGKPVTTWEELQNIMDKRYIPKDFPEDIKERYGRRPARKKVLPASLLTLTDEQREAIVSGVIEGLRSYPELFQFDDPITSKEGELREIQEDNNQMIPATPLSTIAAIEESKEKDQQLVVLCEENQQLEELDQEEESKALGVIIMDQNVVEETEFNGSKSVCEKEHPMVKTGENHGLFFCFDQLQPVVWIEHNVGEHLRHVKGLPHFVFEPGGRACMSSNISIRIAEPRLAASEAMGFQQSLSECFWNDKREQCYVFEPGGNMIINKFVPQEKLDLRTNPFKGGGNDANRVSCLENRFDVGALKEAYLFNQKDLGNKAKCSGKLTHQSIFRNWSHHNDIKGLGVMNFANWSHLVVCNLDVSVFQRVIRPNQKEPMCKPNLSTILMHNVSFESWFQVKSYLELKVMNFLNRRFYRLLICEYQSLDVVYSPYKRRPEPKPIIDFKRDLLAFQQAQNEENWTWEYQVMISLLKRAKPVLHLLHLEFRLFDNLQTKQWRPGDELGPSKEK